MPFDTQSKELVEATEENSVLPLVCVWFYPVGARAGTNPTFYDQFGNVIVTSFLFQYGQGTGTSVQVTFTCGRWTLFDVPLPGSTTTTTSEAPKFGGSGWTATATKFEGHNGQHYAYRCPAAIEEVAGPSDDVSGDNVWGTAIYTDDSSVCAAAVNYGLITIDAGGTVTIQVEPGAKSYTGSDRNGTTTQSYGPFTGSFVFIGQPVWNTDVGYGGSGWEASATSFRGANGKRYLYICPPNGSAAEIWGTGTYTDDSPVCTAAVQEGVRAKEGPITLASGGDVTIEIEPGASSYTGSTKNGITSGDYGADPGSYIFVTVTARAQQAPAR